MGRARHLELVLRDSGLEAETSQGLLAGLVRAGDITSCRQAIAAYLFRRAVTLGKLPGDRIVPSAEYAELRDVLRGFVNALHPFILGEPDALDASTVFREVWLLWMNDQLRQQVPVSHLLTPEEDEAALRGGVIAVVLRALYPDISSPEAARVSKIFFWAVDHPNDALAVISKAKEEGVRPVFPV